MAEKPANRERLVSRIRSMTEDQIADLLDYVEAISPTPQRTPPLGAAEDELIAALAEAVENRRARTALEWDRVRRRAERVLSQRYRAGRPV
jgi:hypothetical protein